MSSFVFMRVLESAPERYDAGIRLLSRGRIEAVYARIANLVARPDRRILDVGCGTGGVSMACADGGADVVGIDINAGMLAVARAKSAGRPAGRIKWLNVGAIEIEDHFEEGSFDAVVSCLAFSELSPAERKYALAVIHSRLKPAGQLVIADEMLPPAGAGRLLYRLKRLPLMVATYALTQTTTHPIEGLESSVRAAGFVDITVTSLWSGSFQLLSASKPGVLSCR